ncbi:MAG: hypothetical protein H6926_05400 [Chromatiales bacterium]|nr:hypothetical protein [Chromatiales bacterium]
MKNWIRLLFAVLALLPLIAGAAPAPAKQANAQADRAEREIGKIEATLAKYGPAERTPVLLDRLVKNLDTAQGALDKAEDKLGAASDPDADAARARIADLRGQLAKVRGEVQGSTDAIADNDAAMTATAEVDIPLMEGLVDTLNDYLTEFSNPQSTDEKRAAWPKVIAEAEALVAKYQGQASSELGRAAIKRARLLASIREDALRRRIDSLKHAAAQAAEALGRTEQATADTIADKSWARFQNEIQYGIERAEAIIANYRAYGAGTELDGDGVADALSQRTARLRKQIDDYSAEVVAANRPAKDMFAGADGAEIRDLARTLWLRENPDHKVLRVSVISENWNRKTSWDWSSFDKRWEKRDYSKVLVAVLIDAGDGIYAYEYIMPMFRLHLQGDTLGGTASRTTGKPSNPFMIIPLAAVN